MSTKLTDRLLSRKEAAARLGLKETTLSTWASQTPNKLRYHKIGRLVRYLESDLEAFIRANARGGEDHVSHGCVMPALAMFEGSILDRWTQQFGISGSDYLVGWAAVTAGAFAMFFFALAWKIAKDRAADRRAIRRRLRR